MSAAEFVKEEKGHRYEVHLDGERVGFIDYRRDGDVIDLLHTEVDKSQQGSGLAQRLADFAITDVRDTGLLVRPSCPFIARHIDRNAAYGSLLASD